MFRNLPPLCKAIVVALVASALLSIVSPAVAVYVLPLDSRFAIHGLQVWRFITYPFFIIASMHSLIGSLLNLFWIGMIVAMFGGELETIIHTKGLTIALATTVIVGGILFSIMSPNGVLAGPGIITMFMLGGFAYMWPKREISIFGIFWVKAWIIVLAIFVVSVIPMSGMQLDTSASNLFGPVFGVLGAIAFLHVTYRQYSFGRAFLNRIEDAFKGNRGAYPMKKVSGNSIEANDHKAVEARIDEILDKIASSGMDSLSKAEREFLLAHSK